MMAGPWERYQTAAPVEQAPAPMAEAAPDGPWSKFQPAKPEGGGAKPNIQRGMILPVEKNMDTGETTWGVMPTMLEGMFNSASDAYTLPKRAMDGEVQVMDPQTGNVSDQVIGEAANAAMWMTPTSPGMVAKPDAAALAAQKAAKAGNKVAQAAERIDVPLPRSVTSDSKLVQSTGKALENQPLMGTPLIRAQDRAYQGIDDAARTVEKGYGTGSIPNAGSVARGGFEKYSKEILRSKETDLYNAVDDLVSPTVKSTLDNTSKVVDDILARRAEAKITGSSKAADLVNDAIKEADGLTYAGVKDLRTSIGELMKSPSLVSSDMSQSELKQIYGALTRDLKKSVSNAGGDDAIKAFEKANSFSAKASAERGALQKLVGSKSDEGLFDSIYKMAGTNSRADLERLSLARKAVDKETWDEVASGVISTMGRDAQGNFSPERFLTAFGKLSGEGKAMLFNSTGKKELSRALDDIKTVSERMVEINRRYGNPSGTARNAGLLATGAAAIASPMATISGLAGGNVMSMILAKPKAARAVADYLKASERLALANNRGTRRALKANARELSVLLANEMGNPSAKGEIALKLIGSQGVEDEVQTGGGGGF
jgi:hypothetical protein